MGLLQKLWPWAGPLAFLWLTVKVALGYGKKWTLGRLGMPQALFSPDGKHFADGEKLEDVTAAVARSGYEQEIYLAMVVLLLAVVARGLFALGRLHSMRMAMEGRWLQYRHDQAANQPR